MVTCSSPTFDASCSRAMPVLASEHADYLLFVLRIAGLMAIGAIYTFRNMVDPAVTTPVQGISEASMILHALSPSSSRSPNRASLEEKLNPGILATYTSMSLTKSTLRYADLQLTDMPVHFHRSLREEDPDDIFGRFEETSTGRLELVGVIHSGQYPHSEILNYLVVPDGEDDDEKILIYDFQRAGMPHPLVKEYAVLHAISGSDVSPMADYLSPPRRTQLTGGMSGVDRFMVVDKVGMNLEEILHARGKLSWADCVQVGVGLVNLLERLHATGLVHQRIAVDTVVLKPHIDVEAPIDFSEDVWWLVDYEHAVFYPDRWADSRIPFRGMRDDIWNVADIIGKLASEELHGSTLGSKRGYYRWMAAERTGSELTLDRFFKSRPLPHPLESVRGMDAERISATESHLEAFLDSILSLGVDETPDYQGLRQHLHSAAGEL